MGGWPRRAQSHGTDRVAVAEPGYGAAQYGRSRNSGQTPVPWRPSQSVIDSVGPAGAGFPAEYSAGVRAQPRALGVAPDLQFGALATSQIAWWIGRVHRSVLAERPRRASARMAWAARWPQLTGHVGAPVLFRELNVAGQRYRQRRGRIRPGS